MTRQQSQFVGFGVQVELKDGKLIQGKIGKATSKGLTLYDVKFSDGGTSQAFKVRASRLRDLKVLSVAQNSCNSNKQYRTYNNNNNGTMGDNNNNNKVGGFNNNQDRTTSNNSINRNNVKQKNNRNANNNNSNPNTGSSNHAENDDWQNDDIRKIKEGEDFDFQRNLSMFNKKDIFAQLRQQDNVDPAKRLISHNRKSIDNNNKNERDDKNSSTVLPNRNENNNKNFDIDKMVIPDAKKDVWNQLTYDNQIKNNGNLESSDNDENENYDEAFEDTNYFPITKSINITHLLHSAVNSTNNDSRSDNNDDDGNGNSGLLSKLEKMIITETSKTVRSNSISNFNPILINPKNNKKIPMATPVQLLEMERLTEETFHISMNDCIDNNFALNSSYYIRQKLGGESRLTMNNSNPEPLVVVLASDSNRSGRKALALSRYLCQTQQVRVLMVFTCSIKDIEESNKVFKANIDIFIKCGGKIATDIRQLKAILAKLNSPIEIIIDAIQGFDCNLIDFDSSQNRIIDMINWCNETIENDNVKVYSIDMPSGYDSGSGLQNFDVAMHRVDSVLCSYTWPLIALANMKSIVINSNHENDGNIVLIDCGIPKNVYIARNSLRKFHGVDTFTTKGYMSLSL